MVLRKKPFVLVRLFGFESFLTFLGFAAKIGQYVFLFEI
jgi:hypothetical protein